MKILVLNIGLGIAQLFFNYTVDFIDETTGFRKPKLHIISREDQRWECSRCGHDNSSWTSICGKCGRSK